MPSHRQGLYWRKSSVSCCWSSWIDCVWLWDPSSRPYETVPTTIGDRSITSWSSDQFKNWPATCYWCRFAFSLDKRTVDCWNIPVNLWKSCDDWNLSTPFGIWRTCCSWFFRSSCVPLRKWINIGFYFGNKPIYTMTALITTWVVKSTRFSLIWKTKS